jgi:hypothetical protein
MGSEPMGFHADPSQIGGIEREYVSGEEIQRRVQEMVDEDPVLGNCGKKIIVPMPKPRWSEDPTGCNWHMHYRGQFPECEDRIDMIVELAQHEMNIGGPVTGYLQ